jgi:hypothetical protein
VSFVRIRRGRETRNVDGADDSVQSVLVREQCRFDISREAHALLRAQLAAHAESGTELRYGRSMSTPAIALIVTVTAALSVAGCRGREDHSLHRAPRPGIELVVCAAYVYQPSSGAVVIDRDGKPGDLVTFRNATYNVHRGDCLHVPTAAIEDVRWLVDGGFGKPERAYVGIHVRGDVADALGERSRQRMSQSDAAYIDGELITVAQYDSVMIDTWWLSNDDVPGQQALFDKITVK